MQNLFSEAWEKPRGPSIGLLSVSSKHWTQTRLTAENKCLTLHFFSCHSTGSALEMLSSRKMVQWPFQICSDKAQRHQLGEDWAEGKCPHLPLTAQSASLHLPPPRTTPRNNSRLWRYWEEGLWKSWLPVPGLGHGGKRHRLYLEDTWPHPWSGWKRWGVSGRYPKEVAWGSVPLRPQDHGPLPYPADPDSHPVWGAGPHPGSGVTAAAPPSAQPFHGEVAQCRPRLLPPQATRLPPRTSCFPWPSTVSSPTVQAPGLAGTWRVWTNPYQGSSPCA